MRSRSSACPAATSPGPAAAKRECRSSKSPSACGRCRRTTAGWGQTRSAPGRIDVPPLPDIRRRKNSVRADESANLEDQREKCGKINDPEGAQKDPAGNQPVRGAIFRTEPAADNRSRSPAHGCRLYSSGVTECGRVRPRRVDCREIPWPVRPTTGVRSGIFVTQRGDRQQQTREGRQVMSLIGGEAKPLQAFGFVGLGPGHPQHPAHRRRIYSSR